MAEPTIVPPPPMINQGDSPEEIQRVGENVQQIFDKIAPKFGGTEKPPSSPPLDPGKEPAAPKTEPSAPAEPTTRETPSREEIGTREAQPPSEPRVPSFIEEALKVEGAPSAPAPATEDEWPEELPAFKSSDEARTRYKNWRSKYTQLKEEVKTLRGRPVIDEQTKGRMDYLENQNKEMAGVLQRISVENHADFQQNVIRPMTASWNEAARILHEVGGDPNQLAQALTLHGKNQFEAIDAILQDVPDSAKAEINNALTNYRRLDEYRRAALANAPQTARELQKRDTQRQMEFITKQKEGMKTLFDEAVRRLRDEAKVEVLQKSSNPDDPDARWWNEQADQLINTSKALYLDNTDMGRMAMACVLAPLADTYRKLWLTERKLRMKSDGVLKDKFRSEPTISESGGNVPGGVPTMEEDLKKPFKDVFLREFHKARAGGAR